MTTTNENTFRTFDRVCFRDAVREAHILALGDRLTHNATHRGFEPSGDDFSTYRMSVEGFGPIESLAIEVEVTGRKVQYHGGAGYLKARITFVGDGEPNTHARGWVRV